MSQKSKFILIFVSIFFIGGITRLWNINFGLPHSFYADEPEFAELAVKYTFELKDIISNNNWYKLIPISFVYGTFPAYFLTIFTIFFTKISNFAHIPFDKTILYIFMRSLMAIFSLFLIYSVAKAYSKLYKDTFGVILSAVLVSLNWKLISHAHYINADIFITVLLSFSTLFIFLYYLNEDSKINNVRLNTLYTILTGIFFGLSVGTKITVLTTLPFYWYLFLRKKDFRSFFAFNFIILATFMVSNPFSIIFAQDFVFRIYSMSIKEAGLVFDSVDLNPLKYILGLSWISTFPMLLVSIFGVIKSLQNKEKKDLHIFLLGNIFTYLVFYSLQTRRVDRWLLPILPIILIYSSYGFYKIIEIFNTSKKIKFGFLGIIFLFFSMIYYVFFDYTLLNQFQKNTPKSASYIWMKQNTNIENPLIRTLVYTEEGLDPLNKLPYADVYQFSVYEGSGAHLFYPQDPYLYKYIVLSSRPMENFKRTPVVQKYPEYSNRWMNFEYLVTNSKDFRLIKKFTTTNPNLIPLSEVYIYENKKGAF